MNDVFSVPNTGVNSVGLVREVLKTLKSKHSIWRRQIDNAKHHGRTFNC